MNKISFSSYNNNNLNIMKISYNSVYNSIIIIKKYKT